MIRQRIYLDKYDWVIHCYYAITHYSTDEIMRRLYDVNADSISMRRAYRNLSKGDLDTGMCYSNPRLRESVLVVALTSTPAELFNSLTHESSHAATHISSAVGIDLESEEYCYLVGGIALQMYPKIKHLLCECCRKDIA